MAKERKKRGKDNTGLLIVSIIFIILTIALFPGFLLITFVAFLPTLGAYIANTQTNYSLPFCVGMCNIATSFPCFYNLYNTRFSMISVYHMLHDPGITLLILGGAGVGWLIFIITPIVTVSFYRSHDKSILKKLIKRYKTIKDNWGDSIPEIEAIPYLEESVTEPPKV